MPRIARNAPGGLVYHVLNRANGRLRLFKKDDDFLAFEKTLVEAHDRTPVELFGWCIMSNHFHLLIRPARDGDLSTFMRWLTQTHAQRWKTAHDAVGHGHLYQGRFKSFPVQDDTHFLTVLRYIERNPLRAKIAKRAEAWRWSSAYARKSPENPVHGLLSEPAVDLPRNWLAVVNEAQTDQEEASVQLCIKRSRPLGSATWTDKIIHKLDLGWTVRDRGRQKGWRKAKGRK